MRTDKSQNSRDDAVKFKTKSSVKEDLDSISSHEYVVECKNHFVNIKNNFLNKNLSNIGSDKMHPIGSERCFDGIESLHINEAMNTNMIKAVSNESDDDEIHNLVDGDLRKSSGVVVNEDGYIVEFLDQSNDIVGPCERFGLGLQIRKLLLLNVCLFSPLNRFKKYD